jgi:sarcosine oxidase subunit gamma
VAEVSTISVTAWRDHLAALNDAVRGLALPPPGRWSRRGDIDAIWVGPDHWWLHGPDTLFATLAPLAEHAALIDISGSRAVLRLSGPTARDILASLVPIDLHPRAFAAFHVANTVAAHIGVQLRQLDDVPSYEISCGRGYGESLARAITLAGGGSIIEMIREPDTGSAGVAGGAGG